MLILQVLVNSLVNSIQVLLLGAGLYLVYTVSKIFHIGQIANAILGAYIFYALLNAGISTWLAVALSITLSAIGGAIGYLLLKEMAQRKQNLLGLLLSISYWYITEALIAIVYGSDGKFIFDGVLPVYYVKGLQITTTGLLTIIIGLVIVLIGLFVIYLVPIGRVLRATSQHMECANLVGIKSNKVQFYAFIITAILASVVGLLVASNKAITPNGFTTTMVLAFISYIVGGVNSFKGTIIATFVLMLVPELITTISYSGNSIPTSWNMVITFLLAMTILYFRPNGILFPKTRKS